MSKDKPEKRWFVYLSGDSQIPEDVGAEYLDYDRGALLFSNRKGVLTFVYAPGTWRFVEFQDDDE